MRSVYFFGVCLIALAAACGDSSSSKTGDDSSNLIEGAACGGIAGIQCPDGQVCVDKPGDGCDGLDCPAFCVKEAHAPECGGFAGLSCPDGLECVDDPTDQCDPNAGGA